MIKRNKPMYLGRLTLACPRTTLTCPWTTRSSKAQPLVQNTLMTFLKRQWIGEDTIEIGGQNALAKGTNESEVRTEQGRGRLLRGHPMTKMTGGGHGIKDRGLCLRTRDEATKYPVAGAVSKIGLGEKKLLSKLGDLVVVGSEARFERVVRHRDTVPCSDQVPKARSDI